MTFQKNFSIIIVSNLTIVRINTKELVIMIYGYCRISREKMSIERQIRNITKEYPTALIIEEVYTRTSLNRKEWNKLFNKVKCGDTIVFDSVSRLSGEADEGFKVYEELYNRGVNLVFLKEPHINTEVYKQALQNRIELTGDSVDLILNGVNLYLMELAKQQIKIAFQQSEKEVSDLHQRVKEGIETARLNGKQIGNKKGVKFDTKKSKIAKDIILKHSADFNGSLNDIDTMTLTGLSRNTYYKYKRELKEEINGI